MTDTLALSGYGVDILLVDTTGEGFCRRVREALPPELASRDAQGSPVSYTVAIGPPRRAGELFRYCVTRDGAEIFAVPTAAELLTLLTQDLDFTVARHSPDMLLVHAGVVGWRGVAIVVPGRSRSGKSTLIAELVRRGAVYYSDEFAVLDESGRVHPYRRPLSLRDDKSVGESLNLARDDVPRDPLPLALIVASSYHPQATWQPAVVRGMAAVLPLIDGAIAAREQSARTLRVAARISATVVTLRGPRAEAAPVAADLLELIDDSLVDQALAAHDGGSSGATASLLRVAERRLRSDSDRPPPSERELVAGRHVRIADFLAADEHRRLLELALACEDELEESGIINQKGERVLDDGFRRSRTIPRARLEEVWDMFENRLRALLPGVRRQLEVPWFPLDHVERQLVLHGAGGFFAPHVDTGDPAVAKRRISCVYYFHRTPRRYTGGELRLFDTWITPTGSTPAASYAALEPIDNSIVFFPSNAFHEVCQVHSETTAFADGRFAVTMWFWEGAWPAELADAVSVDASDADTPSRSAVAAAARSASSTRRAAMRADAASSPRTPGEVALTYDPHRATDGVGSQLHRIYGLYALSRALHVKYVHTPLADVTYQGFVPLLTGRADPSFAARYNEFFSLPSDDFDLATCESARIHVLGEDTVERYAQRAAATGRSVLLQVTHHYGHTDTHPDVLQAVRAVSPYRDYQASGPVRVCIHVRRGDTAVRGRSDGQARLLPNEYYLRVCRVVLEALRRLDAPFVVRVHSEVAPGRYTVNPDTPGVFFQLNEPAIVDPSDYSLEDFEALPNVEMVLNVEAREAIDDFATADVLILSLSSLGYLGGLLNPHGLVVYAPWWHPALPGWLVADEHGNLDAEQIQTSIADHLRRRS